MIRWTTILFFSLLAIQSCKPKFDIYSDYEELYSVYAVLNPELDTQFVRIGRIFRSESDLLEFISENDISATGLNVSITSGQETWVAQEIESPRDSGLFNPSQRLYAIGFKPKPGKTYHLEIRNPASENLLITAHTTVPQNPTITSPSQPYLLPNGTYTLPTVEFNKDYLVEFKDPPSASGFQVYVKVNPQVGSGYKVISWKNRNPFFRNEFCYSNPQLQLVCYVIGEYAVPRVFRTQLEGDLSSVVYDNSPQFADNPSNLNQSAAIEVTALDTFFMRYYKSNQAFGFGVNMLMDQPEATNLTGGNAGFFGSINTARTYIRLGTCTQYLGGLKGDVPFPSGCSW